MSSSIARVRPFPGVDLSVNDRRDALAEADDGREIAARPSSRTRSSVVISGADAPRGCPSTAADVDLVHVHAEGASAAQGDRGEGFVIEAPRSSTRVRPLEACGPTGRQHDGDQYPPAIDVISAQLESIPLHPWRPAWRRNRRRFVEEAITPSSLKAACAELSGGRAADFVVGDEALLLWMSIDDHAQTCWRTGCGPRWWLS